MSTADEIGKFVADLRAFDPVAGDSVGTLLNSIFTDDHPASIEASDAIRAAMCQRGLSSIARAEKMLPIFTKFADALRVEH